MKRKLWFAQWSQSIPFNQMFNTGKLCDSHIPQGCSFCWFWAPLLISSGAQHARLGK